MLNVLLIEENINYGTKLINLLASTSKLFRLAGIVNNLKDLKYILNHQKVELILFDMKVLDFENQIYRYLLNNVNKQSIILILEKVDLKNLPMVKYIKKNNDIDKVIKTIDLLLLKQNSFILDYPNNLNETIIKSKIKKELINIGYNLEYLGTKYIIESIYILYSLKDYYDNNLNRDIYSIIAKKYGRNINNIKCNIGNATNIMYFENKEEKLKRYFGKKNFSKPSPRKVIFTVLNKIKNK